ncbi:MAG TPA: DMT family transporter [Sneathiellales bacterium]|nr:DMT family transporter [Sneathiellales bacterium]
MPSSQSDRQHSLRGILFMCAATIILFPLMNAAVKYLGGEGYPIVQIVFFRSLIHFLWMVALFLPTQGWRIFVTNRPALQLGRSVLQLIALTTYVIGVRHIPLSTAAGVGFTAPLLVVVLSVPLLGEKVGPRRWAAVFVGFIGALVIIRPGTEVFQPANFFILAAAFSYALYQILTRRVSEHDDYRVTGVYTIFASLAISTILVGFDWKTPDSGLDWLILLTLGIVGGGGHFFMIRAYQYGEASVLGPLDYGQLLGATLLGYLIFAEFPDLWTWVGAGIIIASGLYIARRESIKRHEAIKSLPAE